MKKLNVSKYYICFVLTCRFLEFTNVVKLNKTSRAIVGIINDKIVTNNISLLLCNEIKINRYLKIKNLMLSDIHDNDDEIKNPIEPLNSEICSNIKSLLLYDSSIAIKYFKYLETLIIVSSHFILDCNLIFLRKLVIIDSSSPRTRKSDSDDDNDFITQITNNCKHLEDIELKSLNIYNYFFDEDSFIQLSELKLKNLSLYNDGSCCRYDLSNFKSLISLNLVGTNIYFDNISSNSLKSLKLNLKKEEDEDNEEEEIKISTLPDILRFETSLTSLDVTGYEIPSIIFILLPVCLKVLKIFNEFFLEETKFIEFIYRCNKLEILYLHYCKYLSKKMVNSLLLLKNLKEISLPEYQSGPNLLFPQKDSTLFRLPGRNTPIKSLINKCKKLEFIYALKTREFKRNLYYYYNNKWRIENAKYRKEKILKVLYSKFRKNKF